MIKDIAQKYAQDELYMLEGGYVEEIFLIQLMKY